jgi:hypothetical protein
MKRFILILSALFVLCDVADAQTVLRQTAARGIGCSAPLEILNGQAGTPYGSWCRITARTYRVWCNNEHSVDVETDVVWDEKKCTSKFVQPQQLTVPEQVASSEGIVRRVQLQNGQLTTNLELEACIKELKSNPENPEPDSRPGQAFINECVARRSNSGNSKKPAVPAASATSGPGEKNATVAGAGSTESTRINPISSCVKTDGFDIFGLKLGMIRRNLPSGLQFARDDSWSTVAVVDSGRPGPIPTLATRAANLGRLYVHLTGPHMPGEPKVFMIYLERFQLGRFERNENAAEILINKFGCPSSQTPGSELTWNLPSALGTQVDIFFAMRPWVRPLSPNADRMPNGIVMAQVQTDLGSGIGTFANVILVNMPLLAQNYRSYLAAKAAAAGRADSAERNRAKNTASPF